MQLSERISPLVERVRALSRQQRIIAAVLGAVIVVLTILIVAVQRQEDIRKEAAGAGDGQLVCDGGVDPYNSTSIAVTNNTAAEVAVDSRVFRCTYKPNRIKKSYYYCDSDCNPTTNPNCDVGVWDADASEIDIHIQPGETRTFSMTVNPCEIAQIDVENMDIHVDDSPTECYNTRSQYTNPSPPDRWPGGISFGIAENAQGYNATTGTCPQPTTPPTNTPVPTQPPTATPTNPPDVPTATPQPTAPPGQPTYTPIPTATPTPAPYVPPPPTNTPYPTTPVSGGLPVTAIGILGGIGLLLLAVL